MQERPFAPEVGKVIKAGEYTTADKPYFVSTRNNQFISDMMNSYKDFFPQQTIASKEKEQDVINLIKNNQLPDKLTNLLSIAEKNGNKFGPMHVIEVCEMFYTARRLSQLDPQIYEQFSKHPQIIAIMQNMEKSKDIDQQGIINRMVQNTQNKKAEREI